MFFDSIKKLVVDFFFPKHCLNCGIEGSFVCERCLRQISFLQFQQCPTCRQRNQIGNFCDQKCQSGNSFDQLIVCCPYSKTTIIKKLIIGFKYNFLRELTFVLGLILKTQFVYLSQFINLSENVLFIPVPIHKKRLLIRGFNQSKKLAESLQKTLVNDPELDKKFYKIPLLDCLLRTKLSQKQVRLHRNERLYNLNNSIEFDNRFKNLIKNKICILIDDVATTCSTLNECSKVLKQNGAKYICGLVLARGI